MQKNPYISLLNLMEQVSRSSNSPDIQIGQILASPPDIKVRYNGIILTKEELWISHYLLAGYGRTAKGHLVSATQNRAGAEEGRREEIAAYSVGFWISRSGLTLRRMKNATIPKMAI